MKKPRIAYKLLRFQKYMLKHPTECPTDWAMATYDCKDRKVARVIASQNLTKLNVSLIELMQQTEGLTDENDLQDLARLRKAQHPISADIFIRNENGKLKVNKNSNDWIEVDDNHSQLKALELTLKIKGKLKENGNGNGIKVSNVIYNINNKAISERERTVLQNAHSE